MSSPDQKFFDAFMLVIGGMIVVALGLIMLSRSMGTAVQREWIREDRIYRKQVEDRLRPAGRLALPGDSGASPAAVTPPVAPAVTTPLSGAEVYNQACMACHAAGIAGAPKLGDRGSWAARISQGKTTLYKHAIEGFQGASGYMPPKGGSAALSDTEVSSAVDYMIMNSQ